MTRQTFSTLNRVWRNKPIRWSLLGILLPISGVLTAYAVTEPLPQTQLYRAERIIEELPAVYIESTSFHGSYWMEETLQPGETLLEVLKRTGIPDDSLRQTLSKGSIGQKLKQLKAGQNISMRINASGDVTDIQFFNDDDNGEQNLVAIEKINGKWQVSTSAIEMETMPSLRSIIIRTSARGAMAQAGIPVEIRESLSEIFSSQFSLNSLQNGDVIRLLYNSMYFRGQEVATGDILAAEVVKQGKTYRAYYYSEAKGDEESGSYYDQNGKPLRQQDGFNVQPVQYTRISSPYGIRVHPVLGVVKMHTGIDYAAPTGTPIKASAGGIVTFTGWKGGYGNTVVLKHSNGVETLYAHMSAFAPIGDKVRAGDVIGYVGSTGRSTGPHLHYEARINGQHVNPSTVALPTPKLNKINMAAFQKELQQTNTILSTVRDLPITVAQID
ncbi:M23 family metallopeptidase [Neisseria weaveri]|uniref:M23 family metallopeptidase n=1 Tax=Neisseria weaveri TaxID=28091 RepID=UPI000D308A7A|nr:peptidoglycan DD-metalloendopeptidase family protein [Neisseria weaveri]